MKAEINNENKARFYGANWGNTVVIDGSRLDLNSIDYDGWLEDSCLELTSLQDISAEDAIDVAKINTSIHWNNGLTPNIWKNSFGQTIVSNGTGIIDKYGQTIISDHYLSYTQVDFLRSRGYLVPWMGLSCEELIEAGWAKYKE